MKTTALCAIVTAAALLTACNTGDPKPDAYWIKHPAEAKARTKECEANKTDIEQAGRSKPPETLTVLERECLYLFSRDYAVEKAKGSKMWN